jgi:hypothetical protein
MAQPKYLLLALVGAGCPHKHPSGVPVVDSTLPDPSSQLRSQDLSLQLKIEPQIHLLLTFLQRNSFVQIESFYAIATFTSSYPFWLSTRSTHEFQLIHLSLQPKPELQIRLPLTFLQRNSSVQIESYAIVTFTSSPLLYLNIRSAHEIQLIQSASCSTSLEKPILPANQRRGSNYYFLTADWPSTWRTPTVQTKSMELQAKPDAQIAASPVPPHAAHAASSSAGNASEATKTPERNIAMTDVVEPPSQEFLLNPLNLAVLDASTREDFIDILSVVTMIDTCIHGIEAPGALYS